MREKINPDSVTLDDALKMTQKEWRLYTFLKLNSIDHNVRKLDTRLWALLTGIAITIATVVGSTL